MKKCVSFLLCLMILLSLFSCNYGSNEDTNDGSNNDSSTTPDTSDDQIISTASAEYDSVLEVYRLIVEKFPIVNQNPRGVATELGIEDEAEIEAFVNLYSSIHLFYPGRGQEDSVSPHHKLGCGYSVKDLNGDGVDELVLLNDEYYVIAVFSYADGKPILLGNYMPRGSCWIDGEGCLHENASSGSMCFSHSIYEIAQGGEALVPLAEYGLDDVDFPKTYYYQSVGGERSSITKAQYDALDEQYGKYLGSVAGAEMTKEYSGLTFTSLYTEAEIAMEMYEAAINDEICVFDQRLGEIKLKAFRFASNLRLDESIIDGKAVLDMDGDGICEYIIRSASMDSVILRYYDGKVYSYSFYFRNFFNVNTDGSFSWNDSLAIYGSSKLTFDGELLIIKEIYKIVNDGEPNAEYYIDGKQVTHEELLKYLADHPNTPVDFTSFEAPWQKTISLEKALGIASEYWNVKNGDIDKETGFPFALLPKNSNNENYSIALSWLVEGSHYSTLEIIEIDSFTGEIIIPDFEPDGK